MFVFISLSHYTKYISESDFCNSMESVLLAKKRFTKHTEIGISLYLNTGHYCWYFADGIFPIAYLFLLIV